MKRFLVAALLFPSVAWGNPVIVIRKEETSGDRHLITISVTGAEYVREVVMYARGTLVEAVLVTHRSGEHECFVAEKGNVALCAILAKMPLVDAPKHRATKYVFTGVLWHSVPYGPLDEWGRRLVFERLGEFIAEPLSDDFSSSARSLIRRLESREQVLWHSGDGTPSPPR